MHDYAYNGGEHEPSEPNHKYYDELYGKHYRNTGFNIVNRAQFLRMVNGNTALAGEYMADLYQSSTGFETPAPRFSHMNWRIAISKVKTVPMIMGALGFNSEGNGAYVSFLYVRKFYQRIGIGEALLKSVESGHKRISLFPESKKSTVFYKKMGFMPTPNMDASYTKELA